MELLAKMMERQAEVDWEEQVVMPSLLLCRWS
jgi:hypothetical protein